MIYRNKCKIYSNLRKEPFAFTVTTMRILLGYSNEPELNICTCVLSCLDMICTYVLSCLDMICTLFQRKLEQ